MSKISIFRSGNQSSMPAATTDLPKLLSYIRDGRWQEEVGKIRACEDDARRKELKASTVPAATISGTFSKRKQEGLIEHSGFICMDIDGYAERARLAHDPYTHALFSSISGNGLAVIVRIDPGKHGESFRWLQKYYHDTYGICIDPAPRNVASLRFVSSDPDLVVNEKSKTARILSEKPHKPKSLPIVASDNEVDEMVRHCLAAGTDIAPDYQSYLNLGFSLASGFGEKGRQWFHALCSPSPKYNSRHADRQYDICLKNPNAGIGPGTFYWMMKNAGAQPPKNDRYISIAAMAKKSGRSQEGAVKQLTEMNGMEKHTAEHLVKEVFSRNDISLKTIAADQEHLIENLMQWLKQNHPIRKNIITGRIEINDAQLTTEEMNSIYLRARSAFNTPNITYDLIDRCIYSSFTPKYHPIKEWVEKNRHRNTTGNIDLIIKSINTDTPLADTFFRLWFTSIAAALNGHPVRLVLALVGKGQTGKTEFFRRLLPDQLQPYNGESKLLAGKDDELLMCQKLILMDDEMGGKSRQDERRFKELTSKNIFSLRAPYGRHNEDFKRMAVLCGTSNELQVINDPTGNTRILPVHVLSMDHELFNSVDKSELFMEAVRDYEHGKPWNLSNEELQKLEEITSDYESIPYERELILQYFSSSGGYAETLTATEIKDYIETNSKQRIMSIRKFGIELRKIFGKSDIRKVNGQVKRIYKVVKSNQQNIPQNIPQDDLKPLLPF